MSVMVKTSQINEHTVRTKRSLSLLTQYCTPRGPYPYWHSTVHQEIPILIDTVLYTPTDPILIDTVLYTKRSLSLLTQYGTHQEIPILIDTVLYTPRDPYPYWHRTVHTKRSLSLLTQYCTPRDPYPYWHSTVHTKRSLSLLTQVLYTPRDPYPYWHSTVHQEILSLLKQYGTHQAINIVTDTVLCTKIFPPDSFSKTGVLLTMFKRFKVWHNSITTLRWFSSREVDSFPVLHDFPL